MSRSDYSLPASTPGRVKSCGEKGDYSLPVSTPGRVKPWGEKKDVILCRETRRGRVKRCGENKGIMIQQDNFASYQGI